VVVAVVVALCHPKTVDRVAVDRAQVQLLVDQETPLRHLRTVETVRLLPQDKAMMVVQALGKLVAVVAVVQVVQGKLAIQPQATRVAMGAQVKPQLSAGQRAITLEVAGVAAHLERPQLVAQIAGASVGFLRLLHWSVVMAQLTRAVVVAQAVERAATAAQVVQAS
jgi:hypothetical protein